jgi:TonB family protein
MKVLLWVSAAAFGWWAAAAWGQGILLPVSYTPVQGAPFTLTLVWNSAQGRLGPQEISRRILRDSAGRQRYEAPVVNGTAASATAIVYDVVAARMIKLDATAKTAEVSPIRVGKAVPLDPTAQNSMPPATPPDGQTLLGTRKIAGLDAWGQQGVRVTKRPDGATLSTDREVWFSVNYRIPLLEVLRPEGRPVATQRVVDFDPSEPDPALFRIPDGYKVSDAPPPPEPEPGTVRIGGNVSAPRVLYAADPEFSEDARRHHIAGNVLVSLVVDENGLPQNVKVLRGVGYGLDEKAVEAVKKYRFRPAMREGVPVKVQLNVEVNFQNF